MYCKMPGLQPERQATHKRNTIIMETYMKTVAKIGLLICCIYFIIAALLISLSSNITMLFMDIITMLSGIYMVLFVAALPVDKNYDRSVFRLMAILFAASNMLLTNAVHWINITAIKPLIADGMNIPEYFQIGAWPSVLMAIDYLGWGLFMGLAFIFSGCCAASGIKLKWLLWVCGCLCLIGFLGVIINENMWYIAPFGYGPGTSIICIKLLRRAHVQPCAEYNQNIR
jgi:hypothetical protein